MQRRGSAPDGGAKIPHAAGQLSMTPQVASEKTVRQGRACAPQQKDPPMWQVRP